MCTVSYIPLNNGFVLTSSRDEVTLRATLKPQIYTTRNNTMVYPKDIVAGGTWIAANNKKQIACLLNGAYQSHIKQTVYSKSRGRVLLDSFDFSSHSEFMAETNLDNVEPFTLLLLDYSNEPEFNQMVWDGEKKYIQRIDQNVPAIWSSVTLYSVADRDLRKAWFKNWLSKNIEFEDSNILDFHTANHNDISRVNILMKRENDLQTLSISQFRIIDKTETFNYHDLGDNSLTSIDLTDLKCIQVLQ
ncbi:MAG: NRDE family protein [Daejeonella sp.]|uniref:NRDE family protein n=1 Tax=Daejeonella sp. TaxID=2805397 RepID=UPI002732C5A0|nr:NRDE family protein [Daejeonella sp.]MDP3468000.1 NRDE family protein [Daejeonella sp.]